MRYEELKELENGTLIVIHGKGFFGTEHLVTYFKKDNLWNEKKSTQGYFVGTTLYPFEWLKLATKKDLENEIELAKARCEQRINGLKNAFEKTEKARKGNEKVKVK